MTTPRTPAVSAITPGFGGLPKLALSAPDGAHAEVYLYGAHVASWIPAGVEGREPGDTLFLSRASAFREGAPIRGGVPIVFPQFGMTGPLPLHGLVRLMTGEFVSAEAVGNGALARFRLADTAESRRQWDHPFLAELAVAIGGAKLSVALTVTNAGAAAFDFTAAFHTYLSIEDIAPTTVEGLRGLRYRDAAAGGVEVEEHSARVAFPGEVNRIYFDAPAEARLLEARRTTIVRKAGFTDVVVWNPGAAKCATMADLEPEDYRRFVCVEAATVGNPVHLPPGETWQGVQSLERLPAD